MRHLRLRRPSEVPLTGTSRPAHALTTTTITATAPSRAALTDVERKALSVFEATGKTSKEETLRLLVRAGLGRLVDQETVEGAILHMERLAEQEKSGGCRPCV